MPRILLFTIAVLASVAGAQGAVEPRGSHNHDRLDRLVGEWKSAHGLGWRARTQPETGSVRWLYGGAAEPRAIPRTDADFVELARGFVAEAEPMLGIGNGTLAFDKAVFLPLGLAGSSDKLTVRFRQEVGGVPVRRGFLNALFLYQGGELISLDTTGLPDLEGFLVAPTVAPQTARTAAFNLFRDESGIDPTSVESAELWIAQEEQGGRLVPTLVWAVGVRLTDPGFEPEGATYLLAARGPVRLVAREELIHRFDVGGTVLSNATPGLRPDTPFDTPVPFPMQYMRVTSSAGTVFTDENGFFNFPGASGPLDVTVAYEGPFNHVVNDVGAEHVLTVTLPSGTGNTILMNPSPTEFITSQANVFEGVNELRDWTRAVNPADDTADFVADSVVNLSTVECNAFFVGDAVHFRAAGPTCPNFAYSSVVAHEMGHWLNELYGSGNGPDGFGEGNADVFAMYLYDDPNFALGWAGTQSVLRTGENSRPFCGVGCYAEVHDAGEVLMGALWKVRKRLNDSLGDAAGDATADLLFNAWMNAYDDSMIAPIIEEHWLVLDDDDGFIANGTPHYDEIDGGFRDQSFPGFELPSVVFDDVTELEATIDEAGPYGVAADLIPVFAASIASADLYFRVDGGTFTVLQMAHLTGNTWTGLLPGQSSPARVEYYVEAFDSDGNSNVFPADAPEGTFVFRVGAETIHFREDFEGEDDAGWKKFLLALQVDWQRGDPVGHSGVSEGVAWSDPDDAFSGSNCWGNDIGQAPWDGQYLANVANYLLSPPIDLSTATTATLEFSRWLTVDKADRATIRANDVEIWSNPTDAHLVDTAWTHFAVDLPSTSLTSDAQFAWRLEADGVLQLGGWTIDDVEVLTFEASPTACLPTPYGAGLGGVSGVPSIDSAGQPATLGNRDFVVAVKGGPPGATAHMAFGFSADSTPALGGTALVAPALIWTETLDVFGQTQVSLPIPPGVHGAAGLTSHFQAFIEDPTGPAGFTHTQGLSVTLSP